MNNRITYNQIVTRFAENDIDYYSLDLNSQARVIISLRGGRIFGPFLNEDDESMLWVNSAFSTSQEFQAFIKDDNWNLGGERVYLGPELQYSVPDRNRFWETYALSPQVDPGHYKFTLNSETDVCTFHSDMIMDAYPAKGRKELSLFRRVSPARDPLRELCNYEDLLKKVDFCGYEHSVTLHEKKNDGLISQTWDLLQINPGGQILIPASPAVEFTEYYEPVDETVQTIHQNHVRVFIAGDRMFKIGYKAPHIFGRAGYYYKLDSKRACLMVRSFYNNPSYPYLDEPYNKPGKVGDSLQIYQDDGELGGFAEIECIGQAIGGETGRSDFTDHLSLWCYVGLPKKIQQISLNLLGVKPS